MIASSATAFNSAVVTPGAMCRSTASSASRLMTAAAAMTSSSLLRLRIMPGPRRAFPARGRRPRPWCRRRRPRELALIAVVVEQRPRLLHVHLHARADRLFVVVAAALFGGPAHQAPDQLVGVDHQLDDGVDGRAELGQQR